MQVEHPGAPLLSVRDVSYAYYTQPVVGHVSFEVQAGELVALVGRNGAGKSTLLRCVAGWTRPAEGEVRILGVGTEEDERAVRRHVALVPDVPSFYDELTAWEHLQFVAQANGLRGWEERGQALLSRLGLWRDKEGYPFTFSRGMRYKLAAGLALTVAPRLLLMDEPFAALDPISARTLWEMLVDRRREGVGILLSSHQLPRQCEPDRYLVLEEGALIAQGTPDELARALALGAGGALPLDALLQAAIGGQGDGRGDA